MNNDPMKKRRITEEELIQQTMDKYRLRFWQSRGIFLPDRAGLYDPVWVEVWHEAKKYMRAGFDEWGAFSEATQDLFGFRPSPEVL